MDYTKIQSERIYDETAEWILCEFYPEYLDEEEKEYYFSNLEKTDLNFHARAVCLSAALLVNGFLEQGKNETKEEFDKRIKMLNPDYEERKNFGRTFLREKNKYASYSDVEMEQELEDTCLRDVRNCLSHGAFEISYNKHTNKMIFVLRPTQSKIVYDAPIIVTEKDLYNAIRKKTQTDAIQIRGYGDFTKEKSKKLIDERFDEMVRNVMLPTTLLMLEDYYVNPRENKDKSQLSSNISLTCMQMALFAAMLTYSQSDYHRIYGADSDLFKEISLIRNSLLHNKTIYGAFFKNVEHNDRHAKGKDGCTNFVVKMRKLEQDKLFLKRFERERGEIDASTLAKVYSGFFTMFFERDRIKRKTQIERERQKLSKISKEENNEKK